MRWTGQENHVIHRAIEEAGDLQWLMRAVVAILYNYRVILRAAHFDETTPYKELDRAYDSPPPIGIGGLAHYNLMLLFSSL